MEFCIRFNQLLCLYIVNLLKEVIITRGNSQNSNVLLFNFYRQMREGNDELGNIGKVENHNITIPKQLNLSNISKTLRIIYTIENLIRLLPHTIAVSAEGMSKKMELLKEGFEGNGKQQERKGGCPGVPMSPILKKSLSKYINEMVYQNTNCHRKNKLDDRYTGKVFTNRLSSKCRTDEVKSFTCTPTFQTQSLGERYYPSEFIHEKCSECTQCMYGSGKCKQHSINVMVYYDADGVGMEKLYTWEERMFTVYTGCTCLVTSDNTIITILDHICGQAGGDPIHCFHGGYLLQSSNNRRHLGTITVPN